MKKVIAFRDERKWGAAHKPKDLAISISLEANELLEIFQWRSDEEALEDREHLKEELADVLIYCFTLANELGMNPKEIMEEKIIKNGMKYPVK